jgi:hypothetical protein
MPVFRHYREADNEAVERHIPNNEVSPDNPYTLIWSWGGFQGASVYMTLVETTGSKRPARNDTRLTSIKRRVKMWEKPLYVGAMKTSQLKTALPEMLALRDAYNLIHRVKLRKQKLTLELVQSITDPKMRQELVEAACLAVV